MRAVVFNDTRVDWTLHAASDRGVNGETRIPRGFTVTFEGPDGSEVFVKVWGKMAMVKFVASDTAMSLVPIRRGTPGRGRARRMPSDAEHQVPGRERVTPCR